MKKFILKPKFSFQLLERKRIWLGLFAGLLLAFFFYLFGLLLKEGLRIFAEDWMKDTWVISHWQYSFINYFLAFISIQLGSVAMFEIWFHKPKCIYEKRVARNQIIFAEARAFIWYFIFWISTITILPWYFFAVSYQHYCFDFLSDYNYVFVLLMVVLYFSLWTTFIRKFKSAWKFQILHLVTTLILSGMFALYVPAKIKNIDKVKRDALISNRFTMNIPYADLSMFNRLEKRSFIFDVFIVRSKDLNIEKLIFLVDNIEVLEEGLEQAIQFQLDARDEWARRFVVARLFVDSEITMDNINMLKGVFRKVGIFKIFFVVMKTADNCNQPQLGEFGFNQKILPKLKYLKDIRVSPTGNSSSPPLVTGFYKNLQSQFINDSLLIIKVKIERQFILNSDPEKLDQISSALELKWKPGYRIILECEDDVKYRDYIYALANLRKFISRQRNLYSQEYFGKDYYDIYKHEELMQIKEKAPYYLDFDVEELKLILNLD